MDADKLQVKIFARPGNHPLPPVESFIPIFHAWIKHRVLSDLMIDVANYAHVPKGPGVVLIGDALDISMDLGDGRLGILHSRKRAAPAPGERLSDSFRRALQAAILMEKEASLAGKLSFSPDEFLFRINDRLAAPNTDATFAALKPELEALGARLFDGSFQLARVGDPKSLFGVRIVSKGSSTQATLAGHLTQLAS